MTDYETSLLSLYDEIAEEIDDEILDEADELFEIADDEDIPDEYYIWCAQKYCDKLNDESNGEIDLTEDM